MAEEQVVSLLRSRGWRVDGQSAVLNDILAESESHKVSVEVAERRLLDTDIKSFGAKALPDAASLLRSSHFKGPLVLQIVSVKDILQGNFRGNNPSQKHDSRLLRLSLTDGHSSIIAIEYHQISSISEEIAPGTKVCIEGSVPLQNGIFLLGSASLRILGGVVQTLYEEWQVERKYGTSSLSTTNASHGQGLPRAPPFQKLDINLLSSANIGFHSMQASNAKTIQSSSSSGKQESKIMTDNVANSKASILAPAGMKNTKINATVRTQPEDQQVLLQSQKSTARRVRSGYELYRPKLVNSKHEEGSESSEKHCKAIQTHSPLVKNVDSKHEEESESSEKHCKAIQTHSPLVKNGASNSGNGNVPEETKKSIDLGNIEAPLNQGKYEVENDEKSKRNFKAIGVEETVPIQNRDAAKKLLNTMVNRGKGEREFKSHKHNRGRGRHHEEEAVLTLEEWERQRCSGKAMANATSDISQDEILARELQKKLDLEFSNVTEHQPNAAEDIRMSIFNYGNASNSNEFSGRKPRGRGRGRRRF